MGLPHRCITPPATPWRRRHAPTPTRSLWARRWSSLFRTTTIRGVAGSAAAGASVEPALSLSVDARVQVDVLNIAGRRVRTLVTDRACEEGITSLAWNCRSDRGVMVPSGAYLVRVTARTEDDAQSGRIAPLMLQR